MSSEDVVFEDALSQFLPEPQAVEPDSPVEEVVDAPVEVNDAPANIEEKPKKSKKSVVYLRPGSFVDPETKERFVKGKPKEVDSATATRLVALGGGSLFKRA